MEEEELREASRAQWSGVAGGWARGADRRESGPSGDAADWMLGAAGLAPGGRVLELACGAGDVGLRAAEAVGPSGRVVCSDFAESMIDVVRERAAARGLEQVEARVLDAEDLRLEGEHFDAVLCRFGLMLMLDPAAALRGSWDALDRGGRVALAVWGAPERNPWLSLLTDAAMKALRAPPPAPGTPGPFALADHARVRELLSAAGFDEIRVEDLTSERSFGSLEEWWAGTQELSGPVSALFSQLPDEQVTAIREDAMAGAQAHLVDDAAVRFPASVVVASARRAA